MTLEVIDFGCRLNLAEGATLARDLAGENDLIVVNSCAVTAEASRQARQAIRRAALRRPGARIVVTGCGAETEWATYAAMPEVAGVIGASDKRDVGAYLQIRHPSASWDPMSVEGGSCTSGVPASAGMTILHPRNAPAVSGPAHARAFVEVQNGCDHDCTFCVTTLARGPARSLDSGAIVAAVNEAVARGHREVVLTGVDVTSYEPSLARLVHAILDRVPALPRLRLSSLDPGAIDDALFDVLAHEPRIMPHVHLSLQSGNDLILKRMKRRHGRDQTIALVERLRAARPGIAVGADLIAGFPTEDDAMAADSLSILDACAIVHAHVFPYSPRPGTAAARMPQVPPALARVRAGALRVAAADRKRTWLASLIGSTQRVLVERGGVSGHAPNFATVRLARPAVPGTLVDVAITGATDTVVMGQAE